MGWILSAFNIYLTVAPAEMIFTCFVEPNYHIDSPNKRIIIYTLLLHTFIACVFINDWLIKLSVPKLKNLFFFFFLFRWWTISKTVFFPLEWANRTHSTELTEIQSNPNRWRFFFILLLWNGEQIWKNWLLFYSIGI